MHKIALILGKVVSIETTKNKSPKPGMTALELMRMPPYYHEYAKKPAMHSHHLFNAVQCNIWLFFLFLAIHSSYDMATILINQGWSCVFRQHLVRQRVPKQGSSAPPKQLKLDRWTMRQDIFALINFFQDGHNGWQFANNSNWILNRCIWVYAWDSRCHLIWRSIFGSTHSSHPCSTRDGARQALSWFSHRYVHRCLRVKERMSMPCGSWSLQSDRGVVRPIIYASRRLITSSTILYGEKKDAKTEGIISSRTWFIASSRVLSRYQRNQAIKI